MADVKIKAILSEVDKVDHDKDKILPGAFDDAIESGKDLNMLYMHRRGEIVGIWKNLAMDGEKLIAEGTIYADDFDQAKRTVKLIRTGQMEGVSIGFRPVKWTNVSTPERPWGWDISELKLIEASIVDVPANDSAHVTSIKRKWEKEKSEGSDHPAEEIVLYKFHACEIEFVEEEPVPEPEGTKSGTEEVIGEIRSLMDSIGKISGSVR